MTHLHRMLPLALSRLLMDVFEYADARRQLRLRGSRNGCSRRSSSSSETIIAGLRTGNFRAGSAPFVPSELRVGRIGGRTLVISTPSGRSSAIRRPAENDSDSTSSKKACGRQNYSRVFKLFVQRLRMSAVVRVPCSPSAKTSICARSCLLRRVFLRRAETGGAHRVLSAFLTEAHRLP
jgi:hypothetical protein